MNVTFGSVIIGIGNRISKGAVIVGRGTIRWHREISTDPTDSECYKSKPFDRTEREPLGVAEGKKKK